LPNSDLTLLDNGTGICVIMTKANFGLDERTSASGRRRGKRERYQQ
jgi:hypothetical protein